MRSKEHSLQIMLTAEAYKSALRIVSRDFENSDMKTPKAASAYFRDNLIIPFLIFREKLQKYYSIEYISISKVFEVLEDSDCLDEIVLRLSASEENEDKEEEQSEGFKNENIKTKISFY